MKSRLTLLGLLLFGGFLLKPHALEFLCGLLALRRLLDTHELAGRLVAFGIAGSAADRRSGLRAFLDRALAGVVASGLFDRHVFLPEPTRPAKVLC